MKQKPELLAPAGNLEKARVAFAYGADAVYVGGNVFGLRKYADNFSIQQLKTLLAIAKKKHKHVYVVLNAFAHNSDIDPLITYIRQLDEVQPHAVIVSDIGVARLVSQYSSIPIHASTQASIAHAQGCDVWKSLGAKRVILARETSVEDCVTIKQHCPIELEVFVHGAMCASYSGKCVISNYASGRDSNRGGCVQSCRHNYVLYSPQDNSKETSTHVMNAKDLMGIHQIPHIIDAQIESLKIEGRMKSNLYVANAVSVYRRAIDYCYSQIEAKKPIDQQLLEQFSQQLAGVSNRTFSSGGLKHRPGGESIHYAFSGYQKELQYIGMVREIDGAGNAVCDVKTAFQNTDALQLISPQHHVESITLTQCLDTQFNPIKQAKPNSMVRVKARKPFAEHAILVKDVS
ncbi:U32 family peptidase [bacterium]|nr:U32 family peptidase [bacterium]